MKKLLLHTCCAPCGVAIIDELKNKYDLTVFFYNPNIYPKEEYLKRKAEVIRVCEEWGAPMIDMDYEIDKWQEIVKGKEDEPEGGDRCPLCFGLRLEKTAETAKDKGFKIFATTLTMGRNKKADIINPFGLAIGKKYGVEFFEKDWKKDGRQEKAAEFVKNKNIYRQNYCGCARSKREV